jgi:hypothetical protein
MEDGSVIYHACISESAANAPRVHNDYVVLIPLGPQELRVGSHDVQLHAQHLERVLQGVANQQLSYSIFIV